jgi:alanine racemase
VADLRIPNEARAWVEVDLDAASRNLGVLRGRLPEGTGVLAVLKADAYGLGAVPSARRLLSEGIEMFGVGDSHEAVELREAGIVAPVLVLGAILPGEAEKVVAYGITSTIHSHDRVGQLEEVAAGQDRVAAVHLKGYTGMRRLGASPSVAVELARLITTSEHVELTGIMTHYASASSPIPFQTESQFNTFREVLAELEAEGLMPPVVHASNTGAMLGNLREHFTMVRTGGGLWGLDPGNAEGSGAELESTVSLRTSVVFLKDFPAGSPVGYHRTFETRRPSRIATIPIGYNDGYARALGNRASALVRGQRVPVVGAVSMDYATLDVTDAPGVETGDVVTLLGTDGDEHVPVEEMAAQLRTIPYEITCGLGKRVFRVYRGASEPETSA